MSTSDDVLTYVRDYIQRHGHSPTVREIAGGLGKAPSTIHAHLIALADRGELTSGRGLPRTVRLPRRAA